ncbi:FAD binding domain protein [Hypoxylon sp. FL0890]|nr:FAD binding domain protein [Hypoxylon sp. FL0890]
MSANTQFRVIVVGGGVAGLTASHCLQKAGIDHVVLERRGDIAPPEGASIAIYPHGARILQQVGILKTMEKACVPCKRFLSRRPDGKAISNNGFFDYVKENHGQDILLFERREFLQLLYDTLPDKTPIRKGCGVIAVKDNASGVEVTLKDGSVEKGDIVIGADGVRSAIRSIMWENANREKPGLITVDEKTSMKTYWKCLVGMGPAALELGESDMTVVHDDRFSFLALTQPDRAFWFVFVALDEPFSWPRRARYTDEDAEALAVEVADHPVSDSLVFGELWRNRYRGALISLEEGVLEHWYHGRIALAGDSVHKVTPNIAFGGNLAMESVVALCNCIQEMMVAQRGAKPSRATIEKAFAKYQAKQKDRAREVMNVSGQITKLQAWYTPLYKFAANWVSPYLPDRTIANQLGEVIRKAPKLDYVNFADFKNNRLPWKYNDQNTVGRSSTVTAKVSSRYLQGVFQLALSTIAVVTVVISLGSWRNIL